MVSIFTAATRQPQGLQAVLSFAGGRGAQVNSQGVPCAVESVASLMESLGESIRVPVLFQYAQNDRFFGPQVSREWFERFRSHGARAEYVLQPPVGRNGHFLFTTRGGQKVWLPTVEKFLADNGVKFDEESASHQVAALPAPAAK
jgi:dienelactone hydrolase